MATVQPMDEEGSNIMADDREPENDDVLDLTDEIEDQDGPDDEADDGDGAGEGDDPDGGADGEEIVVSFGDDEEEQPGDSNTVIRTLREQLKEEKQRRKDAESRVPAAPAIKVRDKPTIEGCGYDEELFNQEYEAWREESAQAEAANRAAEEETKAANESWAEAHRKFEEKAASHGFPDFKDAQERVDAALGRISPVILKAAQDPALFVYAIGKSDAKLAELTKIKDPFELAATIARMEGAIKVVKGRKAPAIDRAESGSARMPGGADKKLEALEAEARNSGDYSKVMAHKRARRDKGK